MKAKKISITSDALNELFRYEPESGKLFWVAITGRRVRAGDEAGCLNKVKGCVEVGIHGRLYKAHRIIWLMVYGEIREDLEIDHRDGNPANNRIENLRLVTHQENGFNETRAKGYYWSKAGGKWVAQIKVDGCAIYLGRFPTEQEARAAYLKAKEKYHQIGK